MDPNKFPKRVPNESHVRIARILNWVLSVIISFMFAVAFYYFLPQIKNYTQNFYADHIGTYFAKSPEQILSIIRTDIIPSIVEVGCSDIDGGPEKWIGSGIYYLDASNTPIVQTNAHVALGGDGKYHGCNVYFPRPGDGSFYDSSYQGGDVYVYHDQVATVDGIKMNGLDLALLTLVKPYTDEKGNSFPFPPKAKDVFQSVGKLCHKSDQINIGEKIYIIGYPGIGGDSITLTDGVISGFTPDGFLKFSATSNHGASGGIVIGQNDGCYYGIVVAGTEDKGSNLGFAIPSSTIDSFLNNLTGETTYALPATTTPATDYLKNDLKFADLKIKYPLGWEISTTTKEGYTLPVTVIDAPLESAIDNFQEGIIIKATDFKSTPQEEIQKMAENELQSIDDIKAKLIDKWSIKLDGTIPAYQIMYSDDAGALFQAPSYVLDTIFVYKNREYLITAMAGNDATSQIYMHIYDDFFKAIKF